MQSADSPAPNRDDMVNLVVNPGISLQSVCLNIEALNLLLLFFCKPPRSGLADVSLA